MAQRQPAGSAEGRAAVVAVPPEHWDEFADTASGYWLEQAQHRRLRKRTVRTPAMTVGDPLATEPVEEFWDECAPRLPADLDAPDYRARFREGERA